MFEEKRRKEEEELAWERFSTTGKVTDYMAYKNFKASNSMADSTQTSKNEDYDRGNNSQAQANG